MDTTVADLQLDGDVESPSDTIGDDFASAEELIATIELSLAALKKKLGMEPDVVAGEEETLDGHSGLPCCRKGFVLPKEWSCTMNWCFDARTNQRVCFNRC